MSADAMVRSNLSNGLGAVGWDAGDMARRYRFTSQRAFRRWWKGEQEPMYRSDYPDDTPDDTDFWFDMKRDAMLDEQELPERSRGWTRR